MGPHELGCDAPTRMSGTPSPFTSPIVARDAPKLKHGAGDVTCQRMYPSARDRGPVRERHAATAAAPEASRQKEPVLRLLGHIGTSGEPGILASGIVPPSSQEFHP